MAQTSNSGSGRAIFTTVQVILVIGFAVGGWFAAPTVDQFLTKNLPAWNQLALSGVTETIVITVVIALLALIVVSIIGAVAAPKPANSLNDAQLRKQQDAMMAKKRAAEGRSSTPKRTKR
ncbi:MAG: hypothetical protein ACOYL5_10540 [Phototrophicaceae bacterium]|jgi:uncharacterized protein YneF (UPF0154 family)